MDKNAIKKYAVWARRELISRVSQRALLYGISEKDCGDMYADTVNGHLLTSSEKKQRQNLISRIRQIGYEQTMEEAAYTWFNRFSALRFMEVNSYLPTHVRVFTDENNAFKPQILTEAIHLELDGLDMDKVYGLKDANKTDELYKYLLITQCNALSTILPGLFTRIEDYTELLFPDNLLREGSVIEQMISLIPEDDWTDQVQIIGWLYQYYNAEPKDKVFADLKKNIKISKENIPAATQLFTPDWIVRYMVENSLGRLWVEGHPNDELKANWKYYLEEAEQEPEVQAQLEEICKEYAAFKPEDLKCIDPCMGSGHILVYMFDVLVQIYEAYGYNAREAAGLILQNNLYGLDIDDRAAQLAYFAVMMKARQYDRRIFSRGIQPHVYAIVESNGISRDIIDYFEDGRTDLKDALQTIITELHDAKEYGSILNVTKVNFLALYARLDEIKEDVSLFANAAQDELRPLIEVAEAMAQKYHTVVTNPPYMSTGGMNAKLQSYVKKNYEDNKSDLYAVFVKKCSSMLTKTGLCSMITQHTWMFLSRYEKMRNSFGLMFINLTHLGARAFDEISGEVVQTVAFVICPVCVDNYIGKYVRLVDYSGELEKRSAFFESKNTVQSKQSRFMSIPGSPIAYWVTQSELDAFDLGSPLKEVAIPRVGAITGNNDKFIKSWWEISFGDIKFDIKNYDESLNSSSKWYPYNKGGSARCWYGNRELVVWFSFGGKDIIANAEKTGCFYFLGAQDVFFKEGITWNGLASGRNTFRFSPVGTLFDSNKGPMLFPKSYEENLFLLGLFNSKVTQRILNILNPSISLQAGDFEKLPVLYPQNAEIVKDKAKECIELSEIDWNMFETSWDFEMHPMIPIYADNPDYAYRVEAFYNLWCNQCENRFQQLKVNEEELNRIFIDIYGLQDELTPEVEDKDVTVRKADLQRDIRSLISYAVGCMFGRYNLGRPGLAYAGGEWDGDKYRWYPADKDNIIPICDDEYFDDDIVARFVKFIETVYGKATLEENLRFIADALGGKGASRDVIRNYFINDFYADHLKIYQKRPIYWLFDSGKKNGFKALIYMHRYQPDTIARIRTDYVHEQQARYRTAISDLKNRIAGASTSERVKLNKQLDKLQAQADEIHEYEEKIHHLADMMIPIDFDDGVKVNYAKFEDVLAKIK